MPLPRLPLVAALLLASAAHASEVAVSEPRFAPALAGPSRTISSVASGNGTDLVAWTEQPHSFDFVPLAGVAYIRTYDAGGAPLQPAQIAIGPGSGALAVWNGSDYFVAYGRFYNRLGTFLPSPDVEAVRVTADGHVIDGSRISLIATRATGGSISALAWDGTHYFASASSDANVKLLLLDREGHVVRSQDGFAPSIAALPGGGFAMLRFVAGGGVELVRVGRDGELGPATALGPADWGAKLEVHGDRIAVVRHTAGGVFAEELDNDARVLVSVALPNDATIRSLVWRESSWVAAYDRTSAGCIVRFESGVASSTLCSDTARQPFAGVDRVAWIENGEVRTSRDLSLAGGEIASEAATMQSDAAAVATATGSIVSWFESGAMHIGGLTRDGSRRAERTIDADAEAHHPALATAGAQTLLVYVDGIQFRAGTIRALRLDADGQPLAPAFTLGHGLAPTVASDGRDWLVVWQSSESRAQVLAARVTANGDATAEVLVFANAEGQGHPAVACSGAGYVVAWTETVRVMTQLVDRNGARIANALTLVDDRVSGVSFYSVSIACGPSSCLVTWSANGVGVFGAVLGPDGTRRSENRKLLPFVSLSNIIIAPVGGGTFHIAQANRYLFIDAAGAPLTDVTWLRQAEVAGISDGRIFYTRVTAPEELLGGATRLFAREEPAPPRMRAAAR